MSHLGNLFERARGGLGLRIVDVARQAGYANLNKGIRRYANIEDGDDVFPSKIVYQRFATVLGLDELAILAAMVDDFEELDRPVPPRLVIRVTPCFHQQRSLPPDCSRQEAEAIAVDVARKENRKVCLVLSRLRALYIEPDGKRFEAYGLPASSLPFACFA